MEERYALLIDADNVSAKYIKPILECHVQEDLRGLDQHLQFQLERGAFAELNHTDPAVQLYSWEKCDRFGNDH